MADRRKQRKGKKKKRKSLQHAETADNILAALPPTARPCKPQTTAFRVIDSTSLISITPSVWGEGTTPALLFETVEPSEDSQVAFTQNMGSCTGLEAIMPVTTAGEVCGCG